MTQTKWFPGKINLAVKLKRQVGNVPIIIAKPNYIWVISAILSYTGQIKVRALVKLIRKAPNPEKGLNPHNL